MLLCIIVVCLVIGRYRWASCLYHSHHCLPPLPPSPLPQERYHAWDRGGAGLAESRHVQRTAHSPHNSSLICQQKVALEQFFNFSCHCDIVLCLKVENPIPNLPLAIHFAVMDETSVHETFQINNHANGKIYKCIFKNMMLIEQTVTMKRKQLSLVLANKCHHHNTPPYFTSQYLTALSSGGRRWRVRNGARTCSSVQRPLLNLTQNSVRV